MEQEVWQQLVARPRGTAMEPLTRCLREVEAMPLLCLTEFFKATLEKERSPMYFSFPKCLNEMSDLYQAKVDGTATSV